MAQRLPREEMAPMRVLAPMDGEVGTAQNAYAQRYHHEFSSFQPSLKALFSNLVRGFPGTTILPPSMLPMILTPNALIWESATDPQVS